MTIRAIDKLAVDAVADIVGGEVGAKLLAKAKAGGRFGYASVLPENAAASYPQIKGTRVFAQPDPSKVREFLDDIRGGRFILPIGRRLPLKDATEGHRLGEKGGVGKILLLVYDLASFQCLLSAASCDPYRASVLLAGRGNWATSLRGRGFDAGRAAPPRHRTVGPGGWRIVPDSAPVNSIQTTGN
jgi:hypothetical protein